MLINAVVAALEHVTEISGIQGDDSLSPLVESIGELDVILYLEEVFDIELPPDILEITENVYELTAKIRQYLIEDECL